MMTPWIFQEYETASGENPFRTWYLSQEQAVTASFDMTVYRRRVMADWLKPPTKAGKKEFKPLFKKHAGLHELRFWITGKRRFRAVGIYRPSERRFILLTGCEEVKTRPVTYAPADAFDLALKHKQAFDAGKGSVVVHA